MALGKCHNQKDMAAQSDDNGVLLEQFRTKLLDTLGHTKPLDIEFGGHHGQRAAANFSLLKAIRAAVDNDWREAGLEREVISETQRQSKIKARGMLVPSAMFATRSVLTTGAVSGLSDGSQKVDTQITWPTAF